MRELVREIDVQICKDGVDCEQSSCYHRYVREFPPPHLKPRMLQNGWEEACLAIFKGPSI
jgi:hypothetical protein